VHRRSEPESTATAERAHLHALDTQRARGGVSRRKALGAHYTPPTLVDHLIHEALYGVRALKELGSFLDPACGSGNFLVAMTKEWARRTKEPIASVLTDRVYGIDIDGEAVRLAREALLALLPARTSTKVRERVAQALGSHVIKGDALDAEVRARLGVCEFGMVLGNPPFLSQLKRGTAASRSRARTVSVATHGAVRRYADGATAFLLVGLECLKPRGRLAFVMPISFLSAGDAGAARVRALEIAGLRAIWSAHEGFFTDANVRVCGVVLERDGSSRGRGSTKSRREKSTSVRRSFGAEFEPLPSCEWSPSARDLTWSPLLAEAFGAPRAAMQMTECEPLGSFASATADFRDQYYGLQSALIEDPRAVAPLVTTKHIDFACNRWGVCDVRIFRNTRRHPAIDLDALSEQPKMRAWLEQRRTPKVLVATQTKIMEAWVDEEGLAVPLVPLLTVQPHRAADLWKVAAAIASPVVAARAVALYAGSALSSGAIKLSAKQLLAMPAPRDLALWGESARIFRQISRERDEVKRAALLPAFAEVSCRAHGLEGKSLHETMQFWKTRAGLA
jgi:SAM-dependent methyltransferase